MSDKNPFESGDPGDVSSLVVDATPEVTEELDTTLEVANKIELEVLHEAMIEAQAGRNLEDIGVSPVHPDPYWTAQDKYQQALHKSKG